MLSIILKKKNITGENFKKALIFCKAISVIYLLKNRKGATRDDIYKYLIKNRAYYHPDEISRFLQFLKENELVINYEKDYWITLN